MASPAIWYVEFPTYRYNEDVKALAKEHGLRICDAAFDAGDGATDVPELTLKPEYQPDEPEQPEAPVSEDLSDNATAVLSYLIDTQPEAKPTVADVTDALGVEVKGADITAAWHKFKAE